MRAAATVTFVAVGSLTVLVPLLLAALLGERATPALGRMREWFERNDAYVVAALFVAIAAKLLSSTLGG